jgi:hypothetical protein
MTLSVLSQAPGAPLDIVEFFVGIALATIG